MRLLWQSQANGGSLTPQLGKPIKCQTSSQFTQAQPSHGVPTSRAYALPTFKPQPPLFHDLKFHLLRDYMETEVPWAL